MSYNSHYHVMSIPTALEIFLSTENFHGIDFEWEDYTLDQISDNEFHIESVSKDYHEEFEFNLRISIDPVMCRIIYDVYETKHGDPGQIVVTDIQYDQVV